MTRTADKNQYVREYYDRINLCIPKGEKAKIKTIADTMQISVNEYLFRLICADLSSSESHILKQGNEFTEEHQKMLDKWHIRIKRERL